MFIPSPHLHPRALYTQSDGRSPPVAPPPAEAPDHVVLTSCPLGGSHVGSLSHTLLTYKTGSHLAPTLYGYHNNIY